MQLLALIAEQVRLHRDKVLEDLLRMRGAASVVSDGDARQFLNGMILSLLEALEGQEGEHREIFFQDALAPAYANGLPIAGAIKGIMRGYVLLVCAVMP